MKNLIIIIILLLTASVFAAQPTLNRYQIIDRCWNAYKTNNVSVVNAERLIQQIDLRLKQVENELTLENSMSRAKYKSVHVYGHVFNPKTPKYNSLIAEQSKLRNQQGNYLKQIELIKQRYIQSIAPQLPLK